MLGASGFIGTNLCLTLDAAGYRTTGFARSPVPPRALAHTLAPAGRLVWRSGDLGQLDDPDALVAGHSYLFDLIGAGLPDSSNANPAQIVAEFMPPKIRLLDACRRQGVRRIIFASSGGTLYGPAGSAPIAETAPTDPISAYGIGKLTAEKYLALYRHLYRLDYRALRIANAYGPHQDPHRGQGLVAAVLHRLLTEQPIPVWGAGQTVRDYIHVDDVVAALLLAAFAGDTRHLVFNVGSGVGRSVLSVIADAARVTGCPARLLGLPSRSSDVAVNILDCARLRQELGWSDRVGWEAGLTRTAQWMRAALQIAAPSSRA